MMMAPRRQPDPEPEPVAMDLSRFAPDLGEEPEPEPDYYEPEPPKKPLFRQPLEDDDSLLSPPVAEASTAALSELTRAMARERGLGVGARGLTIEQMIRDMLRPLLKEWLDHNLPHVVEGIVRKEIERIVHRVENM